MDIKLWNWTAKLKYDIPVSLLWTVGLCAFFNYELIWSLGKNCKIIHTTSYQIVEQNR